MSHQETAGVRKQCIVELKQQRLAVVRQLLCPIYFAHWGANNEESDVLESLQ